MLPVKLRNKTFDKISSVTMRRFFTPISIKSATGLAREVYLQSERDFFVNGTITSHAAAPEIMAGMWVGGRETTLTNIVAKASYQIDDGAIEKVVRRGMSEAELVKLGAWGALLGAKTISNWCAR